MFILLEKWTSTQISACLNPNTVQFSNAGIVGWAKVYTSWGEQIGWADDYRMEMDVLRWEEHNL